VKDSQKLRLEAQEQRGMAANASDLHKQDEAEWHTRRAEMLDDQAADLEEIGH
jgi:hypothetical protein